MGRKIIFGILLITIGFSVTGCADFDLHVKDEARGIKPVVIILGQFDIRNMNYDPFVSEEFRDALKFEFFRRGFNPVTVNKSDGDPINESDWAAKVCGERNADLLVTGVISQRESGFLADRKTDTLITFTIFGKTGSVIGKGFYHVDESAGDENVRRGAADKFVSELLTSLEKDE